MKKGEICVVEWAGIGLRKQILYDHSKQATVEVKLKEIQRTLCIGMSFRNTKEETSPVVQ